MPHAAAYPQTSPSERLPRQSASFVLGLAVTLSLTIGLSTSWLAPPRFDGAGYAVLAESLRTGRGYRAIDQPGAPLHAHFPPGYPIALACVWSITGPSILAAHLFSALCTAGAIVLFARWFQTVDPGSVSPLLAWPLALNWAWTRTAGAIQSEPLFLLLCALLLVLYRPAQRRGPAWLFALGLLAAACSLTRHVGLMLALALLIDLGQASGRRSASAFALGLTVGVLPWAVWLARVGTQTQLGLLANPGLPALVRSQARFYLERIPDMLAGPFVEVATVFRPGWKPIGLAWAALGSLTVLLGLAACVRSHTLRLPGLAALLTLALLLLWPFQEAGRFLIPLVPFLLVGASEAIRLLFERPRPTWARTPAAGTAAALVLLGLALPYSTLQLVANARAAAGPAPLAPAFDRACGWIARNATRPGTILSSQGAETFWLSGRTRAVVVCHPDDNPSAIARLIERDKVAYAIDEGQRIAGATPSSVARYAAAYPGAVREMWSDELGLARVYAIEPP